MTTASQEEFVFENLFFDPAANTKAPQPPNVKCLDILINGQIERDATARIETVVSPIRRKGKAADANFDDSIKIGEYAYCTQATAIRAAEAARDAYGGGKGDWARAAPRVRIAAVKKFCDGLKAARDEIANILMWEICKNKSAAYKEVDRTVVYLLDTIAELKKLENSSTAVVRDSGIVAQIKRAPLGVVLCAAPYNYPLNETYTTLIPALIMGNTVVLKTPSTGGLCHQPTLKLFAECFPPGVVNIIHGAGRELFTPIMKSGIVNCLAFIGSSTAAYALHQQHPQPFTLRLSLGLDAKNPAFILPSADLDVAAKECTLGALSFCGQRCTAIKIIFVHESIADKFIEKFVAAVDALTIGMPWDGCDITPLAEKGKPAYLREVIADCVANGAKIVNKNGGKFDRSLVFPSVMYPCTLNMKAAREEQFGPLVPVLRYKEISELENYMINTKFGQQAAIFTSTKSDLPPLIDFLAHQVTVRKILPFTLTISDKQNQTKFTHQHTADCGERQRININSQCQRGPDMLPFSGRKCSATGTLSVYDALRAMSIRVAVAANDNEANIDLMTVRVYGRCC